VKALRVDKSVLRVVGRPVELSVTVSTSLLDARQFLREAYATINTYLDLVAPVGVVQRLEVVLHDQTLLDAVSDVCTARSSIHLQLV